MIRRNQLLIGLLLLALLLSGCSESTPAQTTDPQPQYTFEEVYLRIMEPYGTGFILSGKAWQTTVGEHTYDFHPSISEEDRCAFITAQEELCAYLQDHSLSSSGLTFRLFQDYVNRTESDNALAFYGTQTVQSWEQILTTVQTVMGDYTNYGYLYALANHIAGELGWSQDSTPSESAIATPELLNLVYTCFDETYTDAPSIAACKALSRELLSGMEDIWSEEQFLQARLDYAEANGIDFTPTYLVFAYNSDSCPLKFQTRYLEIFRDQTYVADFSYKEGLIDEDFLADTQQIIETFQWLDDQLTVLRDHFDIADDYIVPVQLMDQLPEMNSYYFENGGLYVPYTDAPMIYTTSLSVMAHEYTHHIYYCLTGGEYDPEYESWQNEAIAHYFTVSSAYEDYLLYATKVDPDFMDTLKYVLREAYDEPSDYIKYLRRIMRYEENPQYQYYLKYYNDLCPAFGEYFVRTYGEETFINCMLAASKTEEYTGKTMDQILEDWCADMADPSND